MFVIKFIIVAALFFVLSPGILVTIPYKGSKILVAAVHAVIFALILTSICACFWMPMKHMYKKKETFENGQETNCPSGQHWVSGKIKRYGYCSPSSTAEILSADTTPAAFSINPVNT
jgi:hypothetical protein